MNGNGNGNGHMRIPLSWIISIIFFAGGLYATFRIATSELCVVCEAVKDHEKRVTVVETELKAFRADQEEMKRDIKELLKRVR